MNRYPYPDFTAASPESEGVRSSALSEMLSAMTAFYSASLQDTGDEIIIKA